MILVIDISFGITQSDFEILGNIATEGRSLIIVANKWDLLTDKDKEKYSKKLKEIIKKRFSDIKDIPVIMVSAKTGVRIDNIMYEVLKLYEKWNTRISTGLLNKWMNEFKRGLKAPHLEGKHLKMKYIMQIKERPPSFYISVNDTKALITSFEKHVGNSISKEFGFGGVPIRVLYRDCKSETKSKKRTLGSQAVLKKIDTYNKQKMNVTKSRRQAGSKKMYGKQNTDL